ncbi:hypothetical protein HMPREF0322_00641 [Desulfitobacterium hafniense DP7]|uniref:Uncharacterized protein n=1 Tax=Desulfitobacterium hafniense DP7 TaxID=537010 RepID=G9XI65_DESHA|nr:hypothetical protein HMPREF0322_00641 [Desulfitobacterium hafniense DP7]
MIEKENNYYIIVPESASAISLTIQFLRKFKFKFNLFEFFISKEWKF